MGKEAMTIIDAILEASEKATAGPWGVYNSEQECWIVNSPTYPVCKITLSYATPPTDEPDAHLIVLLRNNAAALCAAVKAGEAWLKAYDERQEIPFDESPNNADQNLIDAREAFRQALARLDSTEGKNGG